MSDLRKLAAILAADVVGFSRMMGADEDATLAQMRGLRAEVIDPAVVQCNGRVVKRMGDGVLVEFRSVVDALGCATALQTATAARNVGLAEDRHIVLRIGIHLGDVVEEADGDLMGDGVNIASRLEGIAEPGTICLSEDAWRQVRSRLEALADATVQDMGEMQLKNIAEPMRVHSVQIGAARIRMPEAPPLPARPSVAVLAFANMSGDAEQEYFSDGISEDIITDLSKVAGLVVVARNSSFAYKGKNTDIRQVGRELGVGAVLEGSIRRAGNRVRITAQLVEAATGSHLWAERYDRDLTDIFAVQDEVTLQIVTALRVTLQPEEKAAQAVARTADVAAHDLFLKGREALFGKIKTRESFDRAVEAFRQAIELDPGYAAPYAGLGMAYCHDFQNKWADTPDAMDLALHFATQALERAPQDAFARYVESVILMWRRDLEGACRAVRQAIALNPNYAQAYGALGLIETYRGESAAAIGHVELAIRLDPAMQPVYLHFLGSALLMAGRYPEAAAAYRERIRAVPNTDLSRALLAVTLGHLGEPEEARRVWAELSAVNPKYSFADHLARLPFERPEDGQRLTEGLAKAGIAP